MAKTRRKGIKKSALLMGAGLLLMAAALVLTVYNQWDERRASAVTQAALAELSPIVEAAREEAAQQPPEKLPAYEAIPNWEMPTVEIDGQLYIGQLEIPSLGLTLPILSQWSYPNLKLAPCRYQGSAYQDNLILAGHNYVCHFGPIRRLLAGDLIYFTDVDGNLFTYQVLEIEILQPTAIEEMESGDWDLTLFTCTLGGRTRLTVRCARIE